MCENVFIQENPYRLMLIQHDAIIHIPWERVIALAVDRVPEKAE